MKFLERFTLIIYSLIMLIISVILTLLIFNWIDFGTIVAMLETLVTNVIASKVTLGFSIVFVLLSIKCMFFDEASRQELKEAQGILLKNENGQLMISKESIDNMVKNAVIGFDNVKECDTKIDVSEQNTLKITLYLTVNDNVIIKELASNLQTKIKEDVKATSDLDVKEVNVKVLRLQENKKSKE